MADHYLDDSVIHDVWDNGLAPRIEIDSGDTVVFECRDASNFQVLPTSTQHDFANRKRGGGHPLTGPVLV